MKRSLLAFVSSCFSLAFVGSALAVFQPLELDTTHSKVGFTASTLLFDVEGRFNRYEVAVEGDPQKPDQAKVQVRIEAASVDTDNEKRDEHLASADFLDAQKHPNITFVSEQIQANGDALNVTGVLELHGQKKKLTVPFRVVRGKNGAGVDTVAYKGKLKINRNDFGVGAGSVAAKISLEDEVALDLLIVTTP